METGDGEYDNDIGEAMMWKNANFVTCFLVGKIPPK
jgi:hypothetical protein